MSICHPAKYPELANWYGVGSAKEPLGDLPFLLVKGVQVVGTGAVEAGTGGITMVVVEREESGNKSAEARERRTLSLVPREIDI